MFTCLLLLLLFKMKTEGQMCRKNKNRKKTKNKNPFLFPLAWKKPAAPLPEGRRRPSGGFRLGPNAFCEGDFNKRLVHLVHRTGFPGDRQARNTHGGQH